MYTFKQFISEEPKKKPEKKKTKNKKDKGQNSSLSNSKDVTHGGMSFYGPGEK